MDFQKFFIPYVFDVKESISRSFSKLPCARDLKNICQLPVSEVLQGIVDWVLWISVISSFLTFSMSRNLFFVVSHRFSVRVTSKIQVNFRFCGNSRVLTIGSFGFQLFLQSLRVRCQGICFLAFSQSCKVRVTLKIQVNFRFCRSSRVLTIRSNGFS